MVTSVTSVTSWWQDAGPAMLAALSAGLAHKLNYSQSSLFVQLQKRLNQEQYRNRREAATRRPLRVLVVGGGPIGLRNAIELALMGHSVRVVEKRNGFSR